VSQKTEALSRSKRAMMTWYGILLLGGMLVCIGCAGPGPTSEREASAGGKLVTNRAVPFFDAEPFDQKVSAAMSTQAPTVTVPLLVPTTLHAIPPRLGTWLAVVQKRGGQVAILPDPEAPVVQESWIDPIPLLEKLIWAVREWQLYKPAEQYNATLYYHSRGELTKVVFTHK
jgi:hypothetical protein